MRRTRGGSEGSRQLWRALRSGDSGQSLIIVLIAMSVVLAVAAFGIDVAQWYGKRHQAQVAADAAALAAANCLATRECHSTGTASGDDAYTHATDYAMRNGVPASNVSISATAVTVTTQTAAPESFAGMFGVHPTVIARAVATYKQNVQESSSVYGADCATPTNPPTNGCAVNCNQYGVTISSDGHTQITGAIETNGPVDISIGGTDSIGAVESGSDVGPGTGKTCGTNSVSKNGNASIADGPADATGFTTFPTTYSAVWTDATNNECSASSAYTASSYSGGNITASGGTSTVPATVTISGSNTSVGSVATAVVICASTSITIPGNKVTLNDVTLVAPQILVQGNSFTITPDPQAQADGGGQPAVALYDTSTQELDLSPNTLSVQGAVYAPMAEINIQGNNGGQSLLEGNTVAITGNNGGDGPTTTLTAFSGSDQLAQ